MHALSMLAQWMEMFELPKPSKSTLIYSGFRRKYASKVPFGEDLQIALTRRIKDFLDSKSRMSSCASNRAGASS
jgi:hypothetical protein